MPSIDEMNFNYKDIVLPNIVDEENDREEEEQEDVIDVSTSDRAEIKTDEASRDVQVVDSIEEIERMKREKKEINDESDENDDNEEDEEAIQAPAIEEEFDPKQDIENIIALMKETQNYHLDDDYEVEMTEEGAEKLIQDNAKAFQEKQFNELMGSVTDKRVKSIIEFGRNGGSGTALNQFIQTQTSASQLEQLDTNNDEHAAYLVSQQLATSKTFSEEKINRMVQNMKDDGSLSEYAEEAKTQFLEYFNQQEQQLQNEQAQRFEAYKEKNNKASESLRGIAKNEKVYKKASSLLAPVRIDGEPVGNLQGLPMLEYERIITEKISNNPEHLAQLVNILKDYDEENGFSGVDIQNKKEKETKNNKSKLSRLKNIASRGNTRSAQKGSSFLDSYNLNK